MTLSRELTARARWVGLCIDRRLRKDGGGWLAACQAGSTSRPPSIRIDIGRTLPQHAVSEFEDLLTRAVLARGHPEEQMDGVLWVVDDTAWRVRQGSSFVESEGGIGERRSEGALIVVLGGHAGQTLDAVGEVLQAALPRSIEEIFRRSIIDDHSSVSDQEVRDAEGWLRWAWQTLDGQVEWLLELVVDPNPQWWHCHPHTAWWLMVETMWQLRGLQGGPTKPPRPSRASITAALSASSPLPAAAPRGPRQDVASWLQQNAKPTLDELGDSGLETIFKDVDHWAKDAATRNALLEARIASVEQERSRSNAQERKTDFGRLAPLPRLGPDRDAANISPGVPILDALWIVRHLLGAFPGQIVGEGHSSGSEYLVVTRVALRMKGASPDAESTDCVLFPSSDPKYGALRKFGFDLAHHVNTVKPTRRAGVYEVAVQCRLGRLMPGCNTIDVVAEFPWRWGGAPSFIEARDKFVARDLDCFLEARNALEGIKRKVRHPLDNIDGVLADLDRLDGSWKELHRQWQSTETTESTGVHEGMGTLWPPVDQFVKDYATAAGTLAVLFGSAGNVASRIADGPLQRFLSFAVRQEEKTQQDARLYGYHPVRLARAIRVEREALREIGELLAKVSTLRDIPLLAFPQMEGAPAVLWDATSAWSLDRPIPFLIPMSSKGVENADPWSERFVGYSDVADTERDLIEPLRPVLTMLASLFPGMSRRLSVYLDEESRTDQGIRPLLLLADAVKEGDASRPAIAWGAEIHASDGVITMHLDDDSSKAVSADAFAAVAEARGEVRPDDMRFPLEVFVAQGGGRVLAAGSATSGPHDDAPRHHVALLVRPSLGRTTWAAKALPEAAAEAEAMAWEPESGSWTQVKVPGCRTDSLASESGSLPDADAIERVFQRLLVLRWRREADNSPRCLGHSLEASPDHACGSVLHAAIERCAELATRVIVVDPIYGAEAIDAGDTTDSNLSVSYADFHRDTGWRITVLARRDRRDGREIDAVSRGLARWYGDSPGELRPLADVVFRATHRAMPAVFRALCRASDVASERIDAELVGHLGVALLLYPKRGSAVLSNETTWPAHWVNWMLPPPEGSLLLSMDGLQRWTWTRRSGTRGDFIALIPDKPAAQATTEASPSRSFMEQRGVGAAGRILIAAIESKGSESVEAADGSYQAAVAATKLRERFGARQRWQERRELLRCIAEEAFRTPTRQRDVYDAIADSESLDDSIFKAICVSTALGGNGLALGTAVIGQEEVLRVNVCGLEGLKRLAGL